MLAPKQPNQSLIDGLACLQELAASRAPLGGRELARRLDLEPTRAHRLVKTLAHLGLVDQLPDKRFIAGRGMHVLSAQSLYGSGIIQAAVKALEDFETGSRCLALGVLWRDRVSYLIYKQPGIPLSASIASTGSFPAEESSIGQLLQAASIPPFVYRKARGGEKNDSLAVPVGDPAFAGLALAGTITPKQLPALTKRLQTAAREITRLHLTWIHTEKHENDS